MAGANAVPAASSCCDQMADVPPPPFDFHTRYGVPVASVNSDGSIEPPRFGWHSTGPVELSAKGPWGWVAVATEMHSAPPPPGPATRTA